MICERCTRSSALVGSAAYAWNNVEHHFPVLSYGLYVAMVQFLVLGMQILRRFYRKNVIVLLPYNLCDASAVNSEDRWLSKVVNFLLL